MEEVKGEEECGRAGDGGGASAPIGYYRQLKGSYEEAGVKSDAVSSCLQM